MNYSQSAGHETKTLEFFADNDDEAVELAKKNFLEIGEREGYSNVGCLMRVCRTPENLLKKRINISVKKGKDLYSLVESE